MRRSSGGRGGGGGGGGRGFGPPDQLRRGTSEQCAIQLRRNNILATCCAPPGFICEGPFGELIDLYLSSESIAKQIIRFYCEDASIAPPMESDFDIQLLFVALNYFRLIDGRGQLRSGDIRWIFQGGPGIRGQKSMRQLRNTYFHTLNNDDKDEAVNAFRWFYPILLAFNQLQIEQYHCPP